MNFSDIMAEAVLSIEKSCLVAHAFKRSLKKRKEKSSDAACAVLCEAYRQIHVSETHLIVFQVSTNKARD